MGLNHVLVTCSMSSMSLSDTFLSLLYASLYSLATPWTLLHFFSATQTPLFSNASLSPSLSLSLSVCVSPRFPSISRECRSFGLLLFVDRDRFSSHQSINQSNVPRHLVVSKPLLSHSPRHASLDRDIHVLVMDDISMLLLLFVPSFVVHQPSLILYIPSLRLTFAFSFSLIT